MADYDLKKFEDTKSHAREMEMSDAKRNNMFDLMDQLYWMK